MSDSVDADRAFTALLLAGAGTANAWVDIFQRFWASIQEGAVVEQTVQGDNQALVPVQPRPGGPISVTELTKPDKSSTLHLHQLGLSHQAIPDQQYVEVVVTARPTAENKEGSHEGALVDAAGQPFARVVVAVTPPPS